MRPCAFEFGDFIGYFVKFYVHALKGCGGVVNHLYDLLLRESFVGRVFVETANREVVAQKIGFCFVVRGVDACGSSVAAFGGKCYAVHDVFRWLS